MILKMYNHQASPFTFALLSLLQKSRQLVHWLRPARPGKSILLFLPHLSSSSSVALTLFLQSAENRKIKIRSHRERGGKMR